MSDQGLHWEVQAGEEGCLFSLLCSFPVSSKFVGQTLLPKATASVFGSVLEVTPLWPCHFGGRSGNGSPLWRSVVRHCTIVSFYSIQAFGNRFVPYQTFLNAFIQVSCLCLVEMLMDIVVV